MYRIYLHLQQKYNKIFHTKKKTRPVAALRSGSFGEKSGLVSLMLGFSMTWNSVRLSAVVVGKEENNNNQ